MAALPTVWVLGDQIDRRASPLRDRVPGDCRVLLVESSAKLSSKRWHVQRLHVVLSAMAHFADELRTEGFDVDHRAAPSLAAGVAEHVAQHHPSAVIAMEPMSWRGRELLERTAVLLRGSFGVPLEVVPNDQFVCRHEDFARWADGRGRLVMEDFYRWQRMRTGVLMTADGPVGGRWNYDDENREPPPRDGRAWPSIEPFELDRIDRAVLDRIDGRGGAWGDPPSGLWPVTRAQALVRLVDFVAHGLAPFGAHEDAMLRGEWKLAHSALSSSMNIGLLHPSEVIEAAAQAYERGAAPINSVEGFIRQVLGWREYVWGVYWYRMPTYAAENALGARRPVPPVLLGDSATDMACVRHVVENVRARGYAHHIERLMVLGNLALTGGVDPAAMTEWMWATFVDGAEWVMLPNVIGMALYADGGLMATKPYAAGGAYINRMSDHCRGCRYDPRRRVGADACPYTTLYWDFLARHRSTLSSNHRMARQLGALDRLADLPATRARAVEVLDLLDRGEL
jgi:deoxyribodipyrimidine photolyase-related protein